MPRPRSAQICAHPDSLDPGSLPQGQREPQRAGAARGLHAFDAAIHGGVRLAEHIGHQGLDETHIAFWSKIGLGILRGDEPPLGFLDRAEHRSFALSGLVNADAEIDLGRPGVVVVELDQREQRIGGLLGEVG